ncbi:MAG: flagellar protein FliT [Fimbriimonadales bacterium]|nr:flagellar protein FliT [Fimbriimonadales bacterium]
MASSECCDRLLVLTLALEESIRQDAWGEAEALLRERGELLERLDADRIQPSDRPLLERCREAEARVLGLLLSSRASVGRTLRQTLEGRRVAAAYSPRSTQPVSLDSAG